MRLFGLVVLGAVAVAALSGCSDSGSESSPSVSVSAPVGSASGAAAEDKTSASASAVATGLGGIGALSDSIAAATARSPEQGKELADGLERLWMPIEGTVKKNDPGTYTSIEDAFADLESGDATKAQQASKDLKTAVEAYDAKFPGA